MNVAGATSDIKESEEIENIMKIFVISQRIKNLSDQNITQRKHSKPTLKIPDEIVENNSLIQGESSLFSARGFN
jgi:hypothetical protein